MEIAEYRQPTMNSANGNCFIGQIVFCNGFDRLSWVGRNRVGPKVKKNEHTWDDIQPFRTFEFLLDPKVKDAFMTAAKGLKRKPDGSFAGTTADSPVAKETTEGGMADTMAMFR